MDVRDGDPAVPDTRLEIVGTDGKLSLTSPPGPDSLAVQLQIGPLSLHLAERGDSSWTPLPTHSDNVGGLPPEAANVARLYAQLASDIRNNAYHAPTFDEAAARQATLEVALSAS